MRQKPWSHGRDRRPMRRCRRARSASRRYRSHPGWSRPNAHSAPPRDRSWRPLRSMPAPAGLRDCRSEALPPQARRGQRRRPCRLLLWARRRPWGSRRWQLRRAPTPPRNRACAGAPSRRRSWRPSGRLRAWEQAGWRGTCSWCARPNHFSAAFANPFNTCRKCLSFGRCVPYLESNKLVSREVLMAMTMNGEVQLPAPRQVVWAKLNDPDVLKASIPGCEELEKTDEHSFRAVAKMKVGPVSARFKGKVTLSDIDPPNGYKISGEGEGGVAGFAKGGATVGLADKDGGTLLSYNVEAQIGGKLAQLGQRLINGAAKKLADEFFANFAK